MKTSFRVPDHDLPDRRMLDPAKVDSRYWTLHCPVAEGMIEAGIRLDGKGVRADVIGCRHPQTGEYGLLPTPEALRKKIIQPADDYLRGLSGRRRIRGGKFQLDWSTFTPIVTSRVPSPQGKGNSERRKETNRKFTATRRASRNVYLRGTA